MSPMPPSSSLLVEDVGGGRRAVSHASSSPMRQMTMIE